VGQQVDSLVIVEELGQGALGRVYLCREPALGERQVVLKVSPAGICEAFTLGQLRHPNIVPIHFFRKDLRNGLSAICMPFLGRSTLQDVLSLAWQHGQPASGHIVLDAARRRERASDQTMSSANDDIQFLLGSYVDCIVHIGAKLAAALAHVHSLGIVHGDLKPSNVLLTPHAEPLLMDFNLSGNQRLDRSARGGTLPYMPPEQLEGVLNAPAQLDAYDQRSDVFSLGVLLYELLGGRLPFPMGKSSADLGDAAQELLGRQKQGSAPLSLGGGNPSESLNRILSRCIAWRPKDRYASARELEEDLQRYLRPLQRATRRVAAHRRTNRAVVATVAACLAIGSTYCLLRPPAHQRLLDQGLTSLQAGDLAAAEAAFTQAVAISPEFAQARLALGRAQLNQGKLDDAMNSFQQVLDSADGPQAAALIGYCWSLKGAHVEATPWYLRATASGYRTASVYNNLGVAYEAAADMNAEEKREAIERNLDAALRLAPESETIQFNRLLHEIDEAKFQRRRPSAAAVQMAKAIAIRFPRRGEMLERCACAMAMSSRPELLPVAMKLLEQAQLLGWAPDAFALQHAPEWEALRTSPVTASRWASFHDSRTSARREAPLPRLLAPAKPVTSTPPDASANWLDRKSASDS
jgi:tetratricopeptide (TPR) repeat protein